MKKSILTIVLIMLVFSLGVLADETLRPDGWSWQKISYIRQLGYVEGFAAGQTEALNIRQFKPLCDKDEGFSRSNSLCILSRMWGNTYVGTDAGKTIDTMTKLYASPQNLPINWGHAIIISQAIVSGVPVSDKDLEVVRKEDATPPKPISEQELKDILKSNGK